MSAPYLLLAVRDDYPAGTCWAWVESAGRACGKPEGDEANLCPRHEKVAQRHAAALLERQREALGRAYAKAVRRLPALTRRLAAIDAEIASRDPAPPTTDSAAYGGIGSTAATNYRRRLLSDNNVQLLAELHVERRATAEAIRHCRLVIARAEA